MYKKILFSTCLTIATACTSFAETREVIITPTSVRVPSGFDTNDNAEILVTGELRNTCYKRPTGVAKIIDKKISIEMSATLSDEQDNICIQAVIPYLVSVPLGQLKEGLYNVSIEQGKRSLNSELIVSKSNSKSIDNYTYANVTNIRESLDKKTIYLEGSHPSSCMGIERVELIANTSKDTVSVLPIIKQTAPICDRAIKPFAIELPVSCNNQNDIVYHVRKLDGHAINFMWQNVNKK